MSVLVVSRKNGRFYFIIILRECELMPTEWSGEVENAAWGRFYRCDVQRVRMESRSMCRCARMSLPRVTTVLETIASNHLIGRPAGEAPACRCGRRHPPPCQE